MELDGKIFYHRWDEKQLYLITKLSVGYKVSWYEGDELQFIDSTELEIEDNLNDGTWIIKE